jgi:hypothetical protein
LKAFPASQAPVSHKSASIGYPWFSPYSGNLAQAGISLPQMPDVKRKWDVSAPKAHTPVDGAATTFEISVLFAIAGLRYSFFFVISFVPLMSEIADFRTF